MRKSILENHDFASKERLGMSDSDSPLPQ
ncbi:uncharacterized protein G2W53_030566 [Senna tora]|uniref:Uncharacterized protein n=1 Tax=Senna tora TaxID=362788 RepID=A0A834T7A1_9FABA|nr:uncharacterized protein G2W53_030566 [Senna tora]